MWAFIKANLTKIVGALITVVGFVQAYPGLSDLMTPRGFALTMTALGVAGVILGVMKKAGGNLINQYKTVIVAAVSAGLSFLQSFPSLPDIVSKEHYPMVMFFLGLALVFCGIINTMQSTVPVGSPTK